MIVKEIKNISQISNCLEKIILGQCHYEENLDLIQRKKKGVFLTNSLDIVENLLDIIPIDLDIFKKKILEPSCGQGIFVLKLLAKIYLKYPDRVLIRDFITYNIFFVDIQTEMVEMTKSNIKYLYFFLFREHFEGSFNGIVWDFTDKIISGTSLFEEIRITPFLELYDRFDYVIGNPPYVTLYGRRDKKENEAQRVNYLNNYQQFPSSVKNGKTNLVMLFIEHSLDLLKEKGVLSFIIDVSFFETAYQYTRKYLLEHTTIDELQVNIKNFDVTSGQIIIKLSKIKNMNNNVQIFDHKAKNRYLIKQSDWYNKNDEYKFRCNGCAISTQILDKVEAKKDKTILQLYPNKNLRTCVMLLDMEEKFTFFEKENRDEGLLYPYYQGSKALAEKYGILTHKKYFFYDKPLQDTINEALKIELEKQGIKNKKRIGLGEPIIYNNPKILIRQSAKEIIATIDLAKGAANNSLYVFSLRNNSPKTIQFLYFLCGFLNTNFITYYAQKMNIIRFSEGKQPQIKIGDLGTIYIPNDAKLQNEISVLSKEIYRNLHSKDSLMTQIDNLIYRYYDLNDIEIENIEKSIKDF